LIAAGQSIGSYRILQKIGTGGMGAVYLAEHPLIGKKVALKVIHRELAGNKEVVQRFFQEAKAVTKIGNEHIVEIHDFGQTPEGDHFYIMEYLEGQTLAAVLANERVLDVMRALHIGAQIAAALAAAHAAGVIHRDLKPDNVMLTMRLGDPNFVVLLDFGLAKMFAGQSAVKTAAGVLLGTPQYMSPEACESKGNLDQRTDIYALGILLFQMMTGMLPFDGETMGEVLVKQVTQLPPPPRGYNPRIPPSVEQIVLRCLAKSVDARFPTMLALREALLDPEAYLRNSPPISPARSLAPGEAKVDAKTVMAYAAQEQRARSASAEQRTRIGMSTGPNAAMPLPAPPPSLSGNADAKTMIGDSDMAMPRPKPPPQAPEMIAPAQPKMNTMRIATPLGYSSRPPRKMWPIVLVLALLLGLGGGAFAVAWFGKKETAPAAAASDAPPAPTMKSPAVDQQGRPDAAVVQAQPPPPPPPKPDAAAAAPHTAVIVIDSTPQGAEVFGSDKASLGKTPVTLTLPISDMPLEYELRMPGYKKKTKQLVVTSNAVINVMLDRAPASSTGSGPRNKGSGHKKGSGDELMRPDDL
jgi:serine/threonine protein kinase